MIEIHYYAFNEMQTAIISEVLSITEVKNGRPSWRVDFVDTKCHIDHWYLFGNGIKDGLLIDDEFHSPDDADWHTWFTKYNYNIEIERAIERL